MHLYSALASPLWSGYQLSLCRTTSEFFSSGLSVAGMTAMLGFSGSYHVFDWNERQEAMLADLDYVGIFLQIAFAIAPLYVLLLPPGVGWAVVAALAMTAAAGIGLIFSRLHIGRHALTWIYVAQGCLHIAPMCTHAFASLAVFDQLSGAEAWLLVVTAAAYLAGSQVYAHATPKLWPRHFGFHELWHLLVVTAAFCTYAANCSLLKRMRSDAMAAQATQEVWKVL